MAAIELVNIKDFAEAHGWLLISQDEEHLRYLTPQGNAVFIRLYKDGTIQTIVTC